MTLKPYEQNEIRTPVYTQREADTDTWGGGDLYGKENEHNPADHLIIWQLYTVSLK